MEGNDGNKPDKMLSANSQCEINKEPGIQVYVLFAVCSAMMHIYAMTLVTLLHLLSFSMFSVF